MARNVVWFCYAIYHVANLAYWTAHSWLPKNVFWGGDMLHMMRFVACQLRKNCTAFDVLLEVGSEQARVLCFASIAVQFGIVGRIAAIPPMILNH